jgi:peptidoglycan/xylan/chitin deacetylase (PgdA/CDA1 family)
MPGYAELQEARAEIESAQHDISETYIKARNDNNQRVIFGIQNALSEVQADTSKKVMLNDLLVEMSQDLEDETPSSSEERLLAPFEGEALVNAAIDSEAEISDNLNTLMKDETFMKQVTNATKKADREPQSIAPSPGKNGNVTGNEFPSGVWAITYDDGPSGKTSPLIFQNLRTYGIPATFFWLAKNTAALPSVVKQASGFELANHSYTHAQLTKLGSAGLQKEIVKSTQVHTGVYGFRPKFFRLPYGAGVNNSKIRSMIAAQGMVHVFWNVDSLDWQDKNPPKIVNRVNLQMKARGRGVVLFHDIHPTTATATKTLMQLWQAEKQQGKRRFLKMSDAIKLVP